jgi:hypothetical protein
VCWFECKCWYQPNSPDMRSGAGSIFLGNQRRQPLRWMRVRNGSRRPQYFSATARMTYLQTGVHNPPKMRHNPQKYVTTHQKFVTGWLGALSRRVKLRQPSTVQSLLASAHGAKRFSCHHRCEQLADGYNTYTHVRMRMQAHPCP